MTVCSACNDTGLRPWKEWPNLEARPCECKNITADCKSHWERYDGPVHAWFSLSYCAYLVVPRLMLQGMPVWWQKLFIWLINMLPEAGPSTYAVQTRDDRGRFIKDDWANYRRGNIEQLLAKKETLGKGWYNG